MPAGPAPLPDAAGYTVRAVADRLGIPTATLRSWNRRYAIGPTQHRPGQHRLYSASDIAVLERMLTMIHAGASPAGAAAAVTATSPTPVLGEWEPLLNAAFALDMRTTSALLTAHLQAYGVVDTWDLLCRPAFAAVVTRQLGGESCIDVEHLLSWSITVVLHRHTPVPAPATNQAVVLACTSGETHALPLEALRAGLAERGVGALMLGADVPTDALAAALTRDDRRPDAVLWSQQESTALTSAIRACHAAGSRVLVGGPGWDAVILPEFAHRLDGLGEAIDRITRPPLTRTDSTESGRNPSR
ncbi:MerR family transcriptional regulator [Nocardia speluncae]|uniref:MerR family transcriptional regulator n=1 Tax=Nocardia speluncae TaxID=419477 RepID=A0A846XBU2_9NOCA|nr:MerR family transcriptional regulator [Nocardia speluncae]NKY32887.1 MerR family transcriptional regulator [Nocardia speluncae]